MLNPGNTQSAVLLSQIALLSWKLRYLNIFVASLKFQDNGEYSEDLTFSILTIQIQILKQFFLHLAEAIWKVSDNTVWCC